MKSFIYTLAIGIFFGAPALAQSCGNALQCIEEKLTELKSFEERLESLEATQKAIVSSIVISRNECKNLGSNWEEFERGYGRFLVSRQPTQEELAGSLGGKDSYSITAANLPAHTHRYQDIYYSIDRDPRGGATRVEVPGRTGSGSHDYNNWGHQVARTSDSSGGVSAPNPIDIMPPFIRVHFCIHK